MTQKDYISIARAIDQADTTSSAKAAIVTQLLPIFAADNPRFQRTQFITACGLFVHEIDGNAPTQVQS